MVIDLRDYRLFCEKVLTKFLARLPLSFVVIQRTDQ